MTKFIAFSANYRRWT